MHLSLESHQYNTLPSGNVSVFVDSRSAVIDTLFEFINTLELSKKEVSQFVIQYSELVAQNESLMKPEVSAKTYTSDKSINTLVKMALVSKVTLLEATELFHLVCKYEKQQSRFAPAPHFRQVDKVDSTVPMQIGGIASESISALMANVADAEVRSAHDESNGADRSLPATETSNLLNKFTQPTIEEREVLGVSAHPAQIQLKVTPECETITLEQINDTELIDSFCAKGKRKIKVAGASVKGLNIELSKLNLTLAVHCKYKGRDHRCVLFKWKRHESPAQQQLMMAVADYQSIKEKLARPPSSGEFRVHSKVYQKIGDVIAIYLDDIVERYGEGSAEWKVVTALINNHLSKPKEIQLPKHRETVILINEDIKSFTIARFNRYLDAFKSTNGVHDKIVSRVKAAFNFALDERLIAYEDAQPFIRATRINIDRHVVIPDDDFKSILGKLNSSEQKDFVFFVLLQATGHFRTQQLMSMKFEQVDFQHMKVRVKPKKGKRVDIQLAEETLELIKTRLKYLTGVYGRADYLFPSTKSSSGHRSNFYCDWNKLCDEFGWVTIDKTGERINKYRFHDFRETLIARISEFNDEVLASQLGHLSTHNIKNYRKASPVQSQVAAEVASQRKPKL